MIVLIGVGCVVVFWAQWLVRQRGAPGWLALVGFVGFLAPVVGLVMTTLRLRAGFDSVKNIAPSEKASVLAERISSAMGWTFGAVIVLLAVALLCGWFSWATRGRPES